MEYVIPWTILLRKVVGKVLIYQSINRQDDSEERYIMELGCDLMYGAAYERVNPKNVQKIRTL